MNKFNNIKTKNLSSSEKSEAWQKISLNLPDQDTSPFNSLLINKPMLKPILSVLVTLGVVFGGGIWTVQASDQARPGDTLYPVDRAVENIRLALASDVKKDDLKIKFAEERVSEIRSLVAQDVVAASKFKDIKAVVRQTNTWVDITVANGQHFVFILQSTNETEIVKMIADRFHVSVESVKRIIDFKFLSPDQDYDNYPTSPRPTLTASGDLKESTSQALDYIIKVRNELKATSKIEAVSQLDGLIKDVKQELENMPQDIKLEVDIKESADQTTSVEVKNPVQAYDDWKTYTNTKFHYSFSYPNDFVFESHTALPYSDTQVLMPVSGEKGYIQIAVVNNFLSDLFRPNGAEIVNKVLIGDKVATKYYTANPIGQYVSDYPYTAYTIVLNDHQYMHIFYYDSGNKDLVKDFEKIIASIKFINASDSTNPNDAVDSFTDSNNTDDEEQAFDPRSFE